MHPLVRLDYCRAPQPPQTKDAALLKARDDAYIVIFDAWDARDKFDKARKVAGKRRRQKKHAANAETNPNRGKWPSGAANRRAAELGERGRCIRSPSQKSGKKVKAGDGVFHWWTVMESIGPAINPFTDRRS